MNEEECSEINDSLPVLKGETITSDDMNSVADNEENHSINQSNEREEDINQSQNTHESPFTIGYKNEIEALLAQEAFCNFEKGDSSLDDKSNDSKDSEEKVNQTEKL